jgi:ribulose-phosphate 3-epimerase
MNAVRISPSILAADFTRLGEQVAEVERCGADRIHVDVMDGHFTLPKIQRVRRMIQQVRPECELELDGGIDEKTAPLGVTAGANVIVAGTSIFGCRQGIETAMRRLREAAKLKGRS